MSSGRLYAISWKSWMKINPLLMRESQYQQSHLKHSFNESGNQYPLFLYLMRFQLWQKNHWRLCGCAASSQRWPSVLSTCICSHRCWNHQYAPNFTTQLQRQYFSIYHRGVNAMGYAEGSSQHCFMIGLHVINVIWNNHISHYVITYNDLDEYSWIPSKGWGKHNFIT